MLIKNPKLSKAHPQYTNRPKGADKMCGIIAYLGPKNALPLAVDSLKRLEYRGYDSWGVAWSDNGTIHLIRKVGRIGEAEGLPSDESHIVIAHTRWATHGGVEEKNAHPHLSNDGRLAVVHNGIIENFASLRKELISKKYHFFSDTDTEVIPNLIQYYSKTLGFEQAFARAVSRLEGTYALVALDNSSKRLAFARKGSPLCIGLGKKESFIASDVSAFLSHTSEAVYLNDGEYGFIDSSGLTLKKLGEKANLARKPVTITWSADMAEKNGFPHFMLKEIMEQPRIITETLAGRIADRSVRLDDLAIPSSYLKGITKVEIISCGTAYHASQVSRYLLEALAGIDADVDYSSEFRYRKNIISRRTLYIFISQSGETADTLAAMRKAKEGKAKTLSIVNVMGSTLARESDYVLYTRAGPEIGVASTKAYVSQLSTMALFAIRLGNLRGALPHKREAQLVSQLFRLSRQAETVLKENLPIAKRAAKRYARSKSLLYIGRNINSPTALEGALKLKEISYLHAEGFPAGELKHGPIALIEPEVPSVCIAVNSQLNPSSTYQKLISNIMEIKARNGPIIAVATKGNTEIEKLAAATGTVFWIQDTDELLSPILAVLPLQLLAYYIARERGCDIDKPRNLAKSVTVE